MNRKSILVIDVDENARRTLAAILLQVGYRVITSRYINDAIVCMMDNRFDLVMLDLRKSDSEGLAFLSNLRLVYPELPVMVMTAYSTFDVTELERCFGPLEFFLKPIEPELLLDMIKKCLSGAGRHNNNFAQTLSETGKPGSTIIQPLGKGVNYEI